MRRILGGRYIHTCHMDWHEFRHHPAPTQHKRHHTTQYEQPYVTPPAPQTSTTAAASKHTHTYTITYCIQEQQLAAFLHVQSCALRLRIIDLLLPYRQELSICFFSLDFKSLLRSPRVYENNRCFLYVCTYLVWYVCTYDLCVLGFLYFLFSSVQLILYPI